jgi:hypothetical protein
MNISIKPVITSSSTSVSTSFHGIPIEANAENALDYDQKGAVKRKCSGTKETNTEDLPELLIDYSSTEQRIEHYRGSKNMMLLQIHHLMNIQKVMMVLSHILIKIRIYLYQLM